MCVGGGGSYRTRQGTDLCSNKTEGQLCYCSRCQKKIQVAAFIGSKGHSRASRPTVKGVAVKVWSWDHTGVAEESLEGPQQSGEKLF